MDDVGAGGESDPQVGSNTLNYIPKWDGSALVTGTIYDNNGKIGIGTSSPGAPLEIYRATTASSLDPHIILSGGSVDQARIIRADAHTGYVEINGGKDPFGGATIFIFGYAFSDANRAGDMQFRLGKTGAQYEFYNKAASSQLVTIQDNGNVGIGTTGPKSKLAVAGLPSSPPVGDTSGTRGIVCITNDGNMWVDDDGTYDCL